METSPIPFYCIRYAVVFDRGEGVMYHLRVDVILSYPVRTVSLLPSLPILFLTLSYLLIYYYYWGLEILGTLFEIWLSEVNTFSYPIE